MLKNASAKVSEESLDKGLLSCGLGSEDVFFNNVPILSVPFSSNQSSSLSNATTATSSNYVLPKGPRFNQHRRSGPT